MSSDELTFPNTDETMPPKKVEHLKSNAQEGEASASVDSGYRPRSRKLPHSVIVKATGLLPMMYKPSELAEDLGIPERTLRDWLDDGAPHERDSRKHIWVNGTLFSEWVEAQKKSKRETKLEGNQGYCFKCKRVIEMVDPIVVHPEGKPSRMTGTCPVCTKTVNRGVNFD